MDRNSLMSVNPLAYGMDDVTDRGSFLPLGRYPYGYDLAWPQPVADMGNTLLSVMRGQPVDYNALIDAGATAAGMTTLGGFMAPKPRGSIGASGGRPALDMSPEAKMARANSMGSEPEAVWYHGTPHHFDEFNGVTWLADNEHTARAFGADRTGAVPPILGGPASAWNKALGQVNVYKTFVRGNIKTIDVAQEAKNIAREIGVDEPQNWHEVGTLLDWANAQKDYIAEAKAANFDGIKFVNVGDDPTGSVASQLVVFDPRNLRSVNAVFDPDQAASANLLAANRLPLLPVDSSRESD